MKNKISNSVIIILVVGAILALAILNIEPPSQKQDSHESGGESEVAESIL